MRAGREIKRKFLVPYEYRCERCVCRPRCRGAAASGEISSSALIDRSACSSISRQPIQFRFYPILARDEPVARRQEFWMRRLFSKFISDQSGATAIEYCLIATGIAIVIITAVNSIGTTLNGSFTSVNSSLK
jgi:pilus assembly protein Flp/PilA